MKQPPQEVANQHLAEFLKRIVAADALGPIPELEQLIEAVGLDNASPWYGEYCKEFYRMLRFGNHEAIDHPVACLLVLPSTFEGEASSSFADLFERSATPLLKQLVRESHAVLHYAFLHDAQAAGEEVHEKALAALRLLTSSSLGTSGHVLTFNSGGMPRVPPTSWLECVNQRWEGVTDEMKSKIAAGMSQADATSIAAAIEELAVRKVAPHVESRIRYLDQSAMSARKGFKNQLKSLLFRKSAAAVSSPQTARTSRASPRDTINDSGAIKRSPAGGSGSSSPRSPRSPTSRSATQYSLASVEAQLRQLSDLALMVGDCDTALSVLRLLASDYKSDKAYFHYAGVQEAMAIATVLYDGPPSDAISNFKEAFYRYDQVAQQAQQQLGGGGPPSRATWYATRAAMRMASYLKALGRYADASYIVMKAHFAEEDLRAALLIEQAALLLLRVQPARVRKFAFHLILAGLRYSKGGARDLAARSYSLGVAVYIGKGWDVVEEHVHEALGKGCREVGDSLGAVEHFAATLTCSQIPAGLQSLHMAQFAESFQAATAQLGYQPAIRLPLPVVNTSKVGVFSAGQASYANGAARQVVPEVWISLESAVCQGLAVTGGDSRNTSNNGGSGDGKGSSNWLDSGGSKASLASATGGPSGRSGMENLCCCVGEDVGVDVEIRNPLQIELAVTKLKLTCTFEAATSSAPAAAAPAAAGSSSPFQVKEERITLHPGEQAVVHLRVKPLRTGSLSIDGVSWLLNGIATSTRAFSMKRGGGLGFVTLNRYPDAEDKEEDVVDTIDDDNFSGPTIKVMPPMPRLELSLETLPPTLLVGQVTKCTLKLKNAGAMTLHALRCAIDTPSVFLELGAGQQVVHKPGKGHVFGLTNSSSNKGSTKLGVNEEMEVVLYARPTQPGPFSFNMCWYYEPLVKLEALPYRTVRATFSANALPSLEMTAWSGPLAGRATIAARGANGSASESKEGRMLVLRGLNLQGIESFTLKEFEILDGSGGGGNGKWKAALAGKEKAEGGGSGAMNVKLGHVVGPESAVVLHAILSSSSQPSSLSTPLSSTQNGGKLFPSLSTPHQYLADGEAKLQIQKKIPSTASVGRKRSKKPATDTDTAEKNSLLPPAEPSHLVLHWEATGLSEGIFHGFNVIPISKVKEGPGLSARLVAPRSIKHNFSVSSVCGIELALEICHEIPAALDVKWSTMPVRDTNNTTTGATAAQGEQSMPIQGAAPIRNDDNDGVSFAQQQQAVSSQTPQRFMWHGATQATLRNVTPGSVVRVPLRLSVISPGWVSIKDCSVVWHCKDAPEVDGAMQIPPCHFYVGEGGL